MLTAGIGKSLPSLVPLQPAIAVENDGSGFHEWGLQAVVLDFPDIIDTLLATHNIFHFRFFGELLQLVAVVLFSRLQLSKISKNVFLIFHFIFIKIFDQCLLIQTTSEIFYRYTWAMDTGRLSLTLCEAIVEEHSQPEEVDLSNSNPFEVIVP